MTSVQKLFDLAVNGSTKDKRRNAFRELRRVSIHERGPEAEEAREALTHSVAYLERLKAA